MNPLWLKTVHVLAAVLGLGVVPALAVVGWSRPQGGPQLVRRLATVGSLGLLVELATGLGLDFAVGGAFHQTGWFRASVLGLVAIGASLGLTRRAAARWASDPSQALAVARFGTLAGVLTAAVVVVMVAKPL